MTFASFARTEGAKGCFCFLVFVGSYFGALGARNLVPSPSSFLLVVMLLFFISLYVLGLVYGILGAMRGGPPNTVCGLVAIISWAIFSFMMAARF